MFFGRGKNKIENPFNLTDMYPAYIEWVGKKELYTVSQKDFLTIVDEFNKRVRDNLLDGREFFLPAGMGRMRIVKSPTNRPMTTVTAVDWPATNAAGQIVHYTNRHSDGYRYKVQWMFARTIKYSNLYYFLPCRKFKRTLAKIILGRKNDYFQSN